MTNLRLSWESDIIATRYTIYRSLTTISEYELPEPIVPSTLDKDYLDSDIELDVIYYYRVVAVFNGIEYISDEIVASITNQNTFIIDTNENYNPPKGSLINFIVTV